MNTKHLRAYGYWEMVVAAEWAGMSAADQKARMVAAIEIMNDRLDKEGFVVAPSRSYKFQAVDEAFPQWDEISGTYLPLMTMLRFEVPVFEK